MKSFAATAGLIVVLAFIWPFIVQLQSFELKREAMRAELAQPKPTIGRPQPKPSRTVRRDYVDDAGNHVIHVEAGRSRMIVKCLKSDVPGGP